MNRCKECNSFGLQKSPDNYALSTWSKENGEPALNLGNFLPLEGYVCSSCGSVSFKVDKKALS